jgi:uncharacterized protein (DUF1501 family)
MKSFRSPHQGAETGREEPQQAVSKREGQRSDAALDSTLQSLDRLGAVALSRRRLVQVAGGIAAGTLLGSRVDALRNMVGLGVADAAATQSVVILVYLDGGNDGSNTLVPLSSGVYGTYRDLRKAVSISDSATLPISADYGLHPSLPFVKTMWNAGQVAVVRGIGYANSNLSHFASIDHWHHGFGASGSIPVASPHSGWIGRYADTQLGVSPFTSIAIGAQTPVSMRGLSVSSLQVPIPESLLLGNNGGDLNEQWLVSALRSIDASNTGTGPLGVQLARRAVSAINVAPQVAGSWQGVTGSSISRQLVMAANLVNAQLGTRVISVTLDGFDTHAQQIGIHASLLADLNGGLATFFARLNPALSRYVTVMTYSEFGRRAAANDSFGTDHGTSSIAMVLGTNVAGGIYGDDPGLRNLDVGGNPGVSTDFRRLYSTVLSGWLAADPQQILGATHLPIPLFAAAPGIIPAASGTTTTTTALAASTTSPTTQPNIGSTQVVIPTSLAARAAAGQAGTIAPAGRGSATQAGATPSTAPSAQPVESFESTTTTSSPDTTTPPTTVQPTGLATGPQMNTVVSGLQVLVKVANGPLRNDTHVRLYQRGSTSLNPTSVRYLNNQPRPGIVTRTFGSIQFVVPSAGDWELRLMMNGDESPAVMVTFTAH